MKKHLNLVKKVLGESHVEYLLSMRNLGTLLIRLNKIDEAIVLSRKCIELCSKYLGKIAPEIFSIKFNLALALSNSEKVYEAL